MNASEVRQLPVKSLSWTANVLLSAVLTWTTLHYFIQPQQVLQSIRQLALAVRRAPFKAVAQPFRLLRRPHAF